VIVALIFGVLTDYLVFFVGAIGSGCAKAGDDRTPFAETTSELLPVILTGRDDPGATLTLLLPSALPQRLRSEHGGCGDRSALVAMTLVPAALAIFGRRCYGRAGSLGLLRGRERRGRRD